jgi:TonB family protein
VNDPVDTVLAQREALDRGFSSSLLVSGLGHGTLLGAALLAAFLAPQKPLINIANGFVVQLPRGGGGTPNPAPAPPAAPKPETKEAEPEPAPEPEPPKIIKPPSEEPRKGLPELESKKTAKKPEPTRAAPRTASATPAAPVRPGTARSAGAGGTGTSNQPFGLEMAPVGPGVPGGADGGDYYMAGVQRKIWTIWMQQVKNDFSQPVSVAFTIMADGSVPFGSVQITQSSGVTLLDNAAQRAVLTAAPFSPLPRDYGTSQITVQANFKPTP